LWRKTHPAVQGRGAALTAMTGFDPHPICDSLDGIAQADFLFNEETRKPNPVLIARFRLFVIVVIVICFHWLFCRYKAA
jgi:hypothetical protein